MAERQEVMGFSKRAGEVSGYLTWPYEFYTAWRALGSLASLHGRTEAAPRAAQAARAPRGRMLANWSEM